MVTAAVTYLIKTEVSIETSINNTGKMYFVPEKKLRQGLKGVKYESGTQRKRQGDQEMSHHQMRMMMMMMMMMMAVPY